jgi:phosphoenolpyruvate-protein phosphotransferase
VTERVLKGLAAAPGLAAGRVFRWVERDLSLPEPYLCADADLAWDGIRRAIAAARVQIENIRDQAVDRFGKEQAAIFDAHLMMLEDPAMHEMVQAALGEGVNPEAAWQQAVETFASLLEGIPDPTLSARAADVRDVGRRVLAGLLGKAEDENRLEAPAVVVARDLAPSQTAVLDPALVLAFCTAEGGPTSHTAILAKSLGIPAVVALGSAILAVEDGAQVLVDAGQGEVTVDPSAESRRIFTARSAALHVQRARSLQTAFLPAVTLDGVRVEVAANIGGAADAQSALDNGADGVGLFRTEFLYLNRSQMPAIAQQAATYRQVFDAMAGKPVVVRTLDIGGDKRVDYLSIVAEPNPFLGWRGIRMIDERPDILRDQLYALLKAAHGTDLRIMLPMVTTVEEVVTARQILEEARQQLRSETSEEPPPAQFGMMVEVPAVALTIEHFAPLVDFFSIGTNDLTQYTLAVDRMNARVAKMATPFAPAVLRLIERTIRTAHVHGKWVGMCGEFAGDPLAAPFLLGAGLDEFSMAPAAIPPMKDLLRRLDSRRCQAVTRHALSLPTAGQVQAYLQAVVSALPPAGTPV